MQAKSLDSIAYGLVTWRQIADDLVRLVSKDKSDAERTALDERFKNHSLLYYHRNTVTVSEAINELPRQFKKELITFSREMAFIFYMLADELVDWDLYSNCKKTRILQTAINEYEIRTSKDYNIRVSWHGDNDCSYSIGRSIKMRNKHLDYNSFYAIKAFCHELFHSVSYLDLNYETVDDIANRIKTPADIIKLINAFQAGYDIEKKYRLQIPEIVCTAVESYFATAFKDLLRTPQNLKDRMIVRYYQCTSPQLSP